MSNVILVNQKHGLWVSFEVTFRGDWLIDWLAKILYALSAGYHLCETPMRHSMGCSYGSSPSSSSWSSRQEVTSDLKFTGTLGVVSDSFWFRGEIWCTHDVHHYVLPPPSAHDDIRQTIITHNIYLPAVALLERMRSDESKRKSCCSI